MMDFWEVTSRRESIRTYDPDRPVSEEVIRQLLGATIRAPSAGNRQPWHFIVVRDETTKAGLASAAYGQHFVAQAPVVIVVCADPGRSATRYGARGRELYCLQDTAAATENLLLAVVALGLGACWVGAFDEQAAASVLRLDACLRPVALIPIGHPAPRAAHSTSRRNLQDVVSFV
jgi:nitroreductase